MVQAVRVREAPEAEAIIPAWLDLAHRTGTAVPYNHPSWVMAWWRQRRALGLEWKCFIAHDRDQRLAGVLPLVCYPDRTLRFAGHDLYDSAEALTEPRLLESFWRDALREISGQSRYRAMDLAVLGHRDATALGAIETVGIRVGEIDPGARISLPATWELYWSTLSASTRKRMATERRALERNWGTARFQVWDGADLPERVAEFWELREYSWKYRDRYDELAEHVRGHQLNAFLTELTAGTTARRELVKVGRLTAGDTLAAAALLLYTGKRAWYSMCTFAPELAKHGPGRLLLAECVRDSIRRRLDTLELGRGVEAYKFALGAKRYDLANVTIMC